MCELTDAYRGLEFYEQSWEDLAKQMRFVFENRLDLTEACIHSVQEYSADVGGQRMVDHLTEIFALFR